MVETESRAKAARLRYVSDEDPGFIRKKWGRGFTYFDPQGKRVSDPDLRQRFEDLVIPPAWTEVWICLSTEGHIQVTGRDDKGRKQYIYHPRWEETRDEVKFSQLLSFGQALPDLRDQVDEDLRRRSFSREKVIALVIHLLDESLLRIGNLEYAVTNNSYGLTTLHNEHIAVNGSKVTFSFPGKGGKQQETTIQNRRLARIVKKCQELPGQMLFQYIGADGDYHAITSTDINSYLSEKTGQAFTAKIFRTWGATVAVAAELIRLGLAESETEAQKNITGAVKAAAKELGNTPTVCRHYYVHPVIGEAYLSGALMETAERIGTGRLQSKERLTEIENIVLEVLKGETKYDH